MTVRSFGLITYLWKGDLASAPANPAQNWVYRNTADKAVYLYDSGAWVLMVRDGQEGLPGQAGQPGQNGGDGYSPQIIVKTDTVDTYILEITYKQSDGTIAVITSPNLRGSGGSGGGVSSVNNRTGAVTLDKTDVGLSSVDDTADEDKPVSTAQQAAIDAETQRAQSAESNEAQERQSADTALQTAVDNEAATRQTEDAALNQAVVNETAAREAADAAFEADLAAEISASQAAVSSLQNSIQTEVSDRQLAVADGVNEAKSYAETLFNNVNTSEFAGPYADIPSIPTPYDTNDLYLVGTAAPYDVYAYIQGQLKRIGGSNVDLSGYYTKTEIDAFLASKVSQSDFNSHTSNTGIHVTATEKTAWNGKQDTNIALTDNAASTALPAAASGTIVSKIQALRDNAKALFSYFTNGVANIAAKLNTARTIDSNLNNAAAVTAAPGFDGSGNITLNNAITVANPSALSSQLTGSTYAIKVIIQRILDNLAYLFSASGGSGVLPVANGGTGLSAIPQYHLLAATAANTLKPYKKGGLGVMSQVSFARPYKQFTNTINRPGFDCTTDVGKAQFEFIGQMKLYTDGSTESVAGKIKIRWAELILSSGGNLDLSGQVILSPGDLIKSFLPAICDYNIGYNSPALVNESAEGVCGKITACNHNGVKYNIYGGALLQYDSTNGLTAVGTIVTNDVATLMYEMEFPIAAMWTSAESTFWGDIS